MGRGVRAIAALALASLVFVGSAGQQQQQPPPPQAQKPTFKSGTPTIVSIFATGSDTEKRLVPNLTIDDFEILDNDKPQPIVVFDNSIRPITVMVMLDTSLSMTNSLKQLKDAGEQFVLRLLPADKARVGAFNDRIEMSSRFTGNRDELVSD